MMAHITGLQGGNCSLVPLPAHMPTLSLTQAVDYSRWGVEGAALCSVSHSAVAPAHRLLPTAGSESDTSDSWWLRACSCRETLYVQTLTHASNPIVMPHRVVLFFKAAAGAQTPFETMHVFPYRLGETGIWAAWFVHAGFFVLCVCPCLAVVSAGILCLVFKFLFLFWAPTTSGTGWISPATEQHSLKFIFATSMDQL